MALKFRSHFPPALTLALVASLFFHSHWAHSAPESSADAAAKANANLLMLYSEAMAAFQGGDYQKAAANLENVLGQAGEGAQLESIFFTLGSAYFNLQQYPKAIEALRKYAAKYPRGGRIADVLFSIGQANLLNKNFAEAAESFKKIEDNPAMHEQALYYEGTAYKELGQVDTAIAVLEKLAGTDIKSVHAVNGAMLLAGLYGEKKQPDKANALIQKILQKVELVDNLARLNSMAIELGDNLLQHGHSEEALGIYRAVRSRDEVIKFQANRVATLQKKLEQNLTAMRADPQNAAPLIAANNQLKTTIADAQKLYDESKQLPDFAPQLLMRVGRSYYEMEKRWESIVAYQDVLARFPEAKEREAALFGAVVSYAEANRPATARKLCEQYLKEFPQGANASTAGYLLGATALQANDPHTAETYFGRMLEQQPDSSFKEEMRFLLANAKFAQGKFDEAIKDYNRYQADFPKGAHTEDVSYRIAAGSVFSGKYEQALGEMNSYLQHYPKGSYAADAKYRIGVCLYAANQYDDVIAKSVDWEKEFGNHEQLGEVLALRGDALAAKDQTDEAIPIYIRSYKAATTDDVLNYSLFAAQKALQKKGDWEKMSEMFEGFVKDKPEHPTTIMAMYWIGKAKAHEGKINEAKQFIAGTIKKYINDTNRDAVEQLLTQLAQLCVSKKTAILSGTNATPAATPAPDPGAELAALLAGTGDQSQTAKARVLYAKAELARLRRQPAEQDKNLKAIADNFKPEELSPMLLAQAGDELLNSNELDKAEALFRHLMDEYPKSDVVDFAYDGLGQIAYQRNDYAKALKYFNDAIEKVGANQKLKDVTLGRAKSLLALERLDEAQKGFEQVASVREWRGEATAYAVYSLGEIEFKRGKWAEANASFQRVFVAYQKYLPWVAKAYIKSGECFEKLDKKTEAIKTYQEMLRNEKLGGFVEAAEAKKRLQGLGAQG